jgi:hypothetical protein
MLEGHKEIAEMVTEEATGPGIFLSTEGPAWPHGKNKGHHGEPAWPARLPLSGEAFVDS